MAKNFTASIDDLLIQAKVTNRLLAAQLRDRMSQKELIKLLMTTGATDKEIADVLNTTPGTVSVTKQRLKKPPASKKTPSKKTTDETKE